MATYLLSQKPSKLDKQDMRDTARERRMNSFEMLFYGPLHVDMPMLADQQELIYINSM